MNARRRLAKRLGVMLAPLLPLFANGTCKLDLPGQNIRIDLDDKDDDFFDDLGEFFDDLKD